MCRLEDQIKGIPLGCEAGLRIVDEYQSRRAILMRQFQAKAVGFEARYAGRIN